MDRIRQFLTLTRLTATEVFRQPITLLLSCACVVLMGLAPLLAIHNFGENGKLARDGSLALHLMFGLILTGHAACSTLLKERQSGTAAVVLSKPVTRTNFFLSKFFGIVWVILSFSLLCGGATLLSVKASEHFHATPRLLGYFKDTRSSLFLLLAPVTALAIAGWMDYRRKIHFTASAFPLLGLAVAVAILLSGFLDEAGHFAPFQFRLEWRILAANALIAMALTLFASLALAFSTRLSAPPTLMLLATLFVLGLLAPHLIPGTSSPLAPGWLLRSLLPDIQLFWMADALNRQKNISWTYLAQASGYALSYLVAILSLGVISFRQADVTS